VTISFMPDGTNLGGTTTSNLQATFNSNVYLKNAGPTNWQSQILKAAQAWAQQANVNFAVVNDNGAASGSGSYQQGDPGMGDIRVGGYNFGNSTLAMAYQPPPGNNYSIAGDIVFNTGKTWAEGRTYDLFTVALHEMGHALGLDESSSTSAAMYGSYTGVKNGLSSDDIAGIQAIYGARTGDAYNGTNNSIATAANINSSISTSTLSALVPDLNLRTTSTVEDFTFQAPAGTGGTMTVQVQSQGLSLLTPKVTVYAADGATVLGSASGLNQYGTTLTVTVSGVAAGQTYYVQVQGADTTAFSTGLYNLSLNFGGLSTTSSSATLNTGLLNTGVLDGSPLSGSGGVAQNSGADGDTILDSAPTITGITPDTGAPGYTNAQKISLLGTAPAGTTVRLYSLGYVNGTCYKVLQYLGTASFTGGNNWLFNYTGTTLAPGTYYFGATATDSAGHVSPMSFAYTATIITQAPAAPAVLGFSPDTSVVGSGYTNDKTPTVSGTATPFTTVSVYRTNPDGSRHLAGTVPANCAGSWSFTEPGNLGDGTYTYTATATDLAGNVSAASGPLSFVINTQAPPNPSITGISPDTGNPTDRVTTAKNIFVLGKATPGSFVYVYLQNGPLLGTAVADSTGAWQFAPGTLADGTYNFTARAGNVAGDLSGFCGAVKVVVETVPAPVIAGVAETFNNGVATLTVSGKAAASDHVQILLNGTALATVGTDGSGNWSYAYTPKSLPNGTYGFSATATDSTNNVSAASGTLNLVLGLAAPYVSAPSLTSGSIIGTAGGVPITVATPTLTGTATPGSTVTIVDGDTVLGTAVANAKGLWSFTAPALAKGTHKISVSATDALGDTSLLSTVLTLQV
jgi:hypothetical protein